MTPDVEIYDTTLRDGTQGHGINLSVADKLRIAERLDAFGVQYVEGGWPGSNPRDIEFLREAKHRTFSSARTIGRISGLRELLTEVFLPDRMYTGSRSSIRLPRFR